MIITIRPRTLAIYARTSKEYKGVERVSIRQQVEVAQRLAPAKGYTHTLVFADPDRCGDLPPQQWLESGQRKYREDLSRLVATIERGEVHGLAFRRVDRLARGTELTLRLLRFFQSHKIKLESTDEELPGADDDTGTLTLTLLAAITEYELKKIRRNTKRGMEYLKRHGLKTGPARDLGYRDAKEKGKVEVDKPAAAAVREIFRRFLAGASQRRVGQWLTTACPQRRGRVGFFGTHIHRILTNPHYIGMRDYEGTLVPSQVFSALVDPATFWKAHEILKSRKGIKLSQHESQHQRPHLLSGLLKCGDCGRNLQWSRKTGGGVYYARCIWKHDHPSAPFHMTEPAWLEWAEAFLTTEIEARPPTAEDPDRALLLTRQARIMDNIAALQVKCARGDLTADLLADALELATTERDKLQRQLDALPPNNLPAPRTQAEMTCEEQRASLLYWVDRVSVYADHVVVKWHKHIRRPDLMFPLMRRRPAGYRGKALNCLTPHGMIRQEANDVITADRATVNWVRHISDCRGERGAYKTTAQFYYASEAHTGTDASAGANHARTLCDKLEVRGAWREGSPV